MIADKSSIHANLSLRGQDPVGAYGVLPRLTQVPPVWPEPPRPGRFRPHPQDDERPSRANNHAPGHPLFARRLALSAVP